MKKYYINSKRNEIIINLFLVIFLHFICFYDLKKTLKMSFVGFL